MIVVRMLLNSWATLLASAPTLLSFWACNSCCRSWSASVLGTITSSPIMASRLLGRLRVLAVRVGSPERTGGTHGNVRGPSGQEFISAVSGEALHRKSLQNQRLSARLRALPQTEGVAARH